jgi:ankyrin repeat protein
MKKKYKELQNALEACDLEKVKELVENENLDLNNPELNALVLGVKSRSIELLEYLIEKGAKVDEAKNVLYVACREACEAYEKNWIEDQLSIIRYLIEIGAEPDFECINYRESPLEYVCSSGCGTNFADKTLELIKLLVETGSYDEHILDPSKNFAVPQARYGICVLGELAMDSFSYFSEKFPQILNDKNLRNASLIYAAQYRQFGIMQALLEAGADINTVSTDYYGKSPLLEFAQSYGEPLGHSFPQENASIDCMRWLIENGADIYQKDEKGHNLLHYLVDGMPIEENKKLAYGYNGEKVFQFFKELVEKGISFYEKADRGHSGMSAQDLLIETASRCRLPSESLPGPPLEQWLDFLKEVDGNEGSEASNKVKFEKAVECRIYYGGVHVLREYINIVLKGGKEVDGSRTVWEQGSFHFKWMLPDSMESLLTTLSKAADWVHYFEDSYREKWQSEYPDIEYDECDWLGGNGMSPGDHFFDSKGDYIDRASIAKFDDNWEGDTESIYFEAEHVGNLMFRDEKGNWTRFDPMPDGWKISQGTSSNSENDPLQVEILAKGKFDLIERVRNLC